MTIELNMLVLTAVVTALLWVPYILSHILTNGLVGALTYAADGKPLPDWAARLKKAHTNAIEQDASLSATNESIHRMKWAQCSLLAVSYRFRT